VSIPDPGPNAAIREALQKPTGPLAEQDLLNLTVLNECFLWRCHGFCAFEAIGRGFCVAVLDSEGAT